MHPTASDVIAAFRGDMIASFIAVVLITMGAGMLLLGALSRRRARNSFVYTGLFTIAYGSSPYAFKPVIDALVLALIAVLSLDLIWPAPDAGNWRLIRIGARLG